MKYSPKDGAYYQELREWERGFLERAFTRANYNHSVCAEEVGLNRATLHKKLKSHGINGAGKLRKNRNARRYRTAAQDPPETVSG